MTEFTPSDVGSDFPDVGDQVRFLGVNGYDFELAVALETFAPNQILTVSDYSIGGWSSTLSFEEFPGKYWNSVMFERLSSADELREALAQ
jgi:hypothetical protein